MTWSGGGNRRWTIIYIYDIFTFVLRYIIIIIYNYVECHGRHVNDDHDNDDDDKSSLYLVYEIYMIQCSIV